MLPNMKLTSDQWFEYINNTNKYHVIIMEHAGGWNAHNLHYEWYVEKISRDEFDRRLAGSTKTSERKADLKKRGVTDYGYHP